MFRFPLFRKSSTEPAEEELPLSELESALRYRCEVRAMDDRPIFLGNAKDYDGQSMRIFPALGIEAPRVIYNNQYKLVFRAPSGAIPVWTARVRGSTDEFWKVDDLTRFRDEQRASFRQSVSLPAIVRGLLGLPDAGSAVTDDYLSNMGDRCQVVDMGMGGLQFMSTLRFGVNDILAVMDLHLNHDPLPLTLPLQVRWVTEGVNGYRCGCSYEAVGQQDERRLYSAMFGLQRACMGRE